MEGEHKVLFGENATTEEQQYSGTARPSFEFPTNAWPVFWHHSPIHYMP